MKSIKLNLLLALLLSYEGFAFASLNPQLVDFDSLTKRLSTNPTAQEVKLIRSMSSYPPSVRDDEIVRMIKAESTGAFSEMNKFRFVKFKGAADDFLVSATCNVTADGSEEYCAIDGLANKKYGLNILEKNQIYDEQLFPKMYLYFRSVYQYTSSRFIVGNDGTVNSLIVLNQYNKTFKKKTSCIQKVDLYEYDSVNGKFIQPIKQKLISKECSLNMDIDQTGKPNESQNILFSKIVDNLKIK